MSLTGHKIICMKKLLLLNIFNNFYKLTETHNIDDMKIRGSFW